MWHVLLFCLSHSPTAAFTWCLPQQRPGFQLIVQTSSPIAPTYRPTALSRLAADQCPPCGLTLTMTAETKLGHQLSTQPSLPPRRFSGARSRWLQTLSSTFLIYSDGTSGFWQSCSSFSVEHPMALRKSHVAVRAPVHLANAAGIHGRPSTAALNTQNQHNRTARHLR